MNPCARCKGNGDEGDEGEFRACQMCGRSGEAVPCRACGISCGACIYLPRATQTPFCNRPSVAWDDESPRCHRHDPEVIRLVRARVLLARERVKV